VPALLFGRAQPTSVVVAAVILGGVLLADLVAALVLVPEAIGDGRYVALAGDEKRVYVISDPLAQASTQSADWLSKAGFEVEKVKTDEEKRKAKIAKLGQNVNSMSEVNRSAKLGYGGRRRDEGYRR